MVENSRIVIIQKQTLTQIHIFVVLRKDQSSAYQINEEILANTKEIFIKPLS